MMMIDKIVKETATETTVMKKVGKIFNKLIFYPWSGRQNSFEIFLSMAFTEISHTDFAFRILTSSIINTSVVAKN